MKKVRSFLCVAIALVLFTASFPIADFAIYAKATNRRNVINTHNISGSDIVAQARKYLGVPYDTSGGNYQYRTGYGSTMMFDCSGFVFRVCKDVGLTSNVANYSEGKDINGNYYLTAHTQEQRYYGTDISSSLQKYINTGDYSELKAGDLLFLTSNNSSVSHVAIYSGSGTIIHSEGWAGCVSEHPIGRYPTSNNWYFAACRLITSNNTTNSEEKKLTKSSYPSHCTIEVTEKDKNIMSLPCSNKTNSKSDKVESAPKGTKYEAIGLILNTEGNLWYKVKAKNGKEGYIFAGNVAFESTIRNDIVASGISVPANHTQGKSYVLTGSVKDPYNIVSEVSVNIYSGSNTSGTSETGGSESINTTSFALGGSSIDKNTKFNILPVGKHTYVVRVTYKNYFAKSDKVSAIKTATGIIYKQTFNVVSSHSHSYSSHYEAAHPHKVYNKCSCGDWHYTGATKSVSSCSQCNPAEPSTIIYPTNGDIYKIASGVANNMYLDFAVTSDNVQIYENCDGHSDPAFVKSQYFKLTHVGDGWYTITNPANGKAMDVYDWRTASGTNIQQWDLHSGDNQLFRFYDAGDGYCYIKSKLGTYVDVKWGDSVNNTNVWTYDFNGNNSQKWKLEKHSHAYSSKVTTAATCAKEGVKTFHCYCGSSYTENINIDSSNHTSTAETTELKATCTTKGYTAGIFCIDCARYISGNTEIAIDTSAHKWDNGTITTTATCQVSGVKTYTCRYNSSHKKTENLGVNASNHVNTKNVAEVPATTESVGYTAGVYCNDCKVFIFGHQEIPKIETAFTDSANAKKDGNDILANNSITVNVLLSQAGKNAVIKDSKGNILASDKLIGTGMTLVLSDGKQYTIVVFGDVDGNGSVSAADARLSLRASVGLEKYDDASAQYKAANIQSDDKITASDARLILRASVGLEDAKKWMK